MHTHIPVLAQEVIDGLQLKSGYTVIDGTLGLGGHAELILKATAPDGQLIGIDRDPRNLELAKARLKAYGSRVTYFHGSFSLMNTLNQRVDGVLMDLGFSSVHVDDPTRGFSFQADGPLDMRYDSDAWQGRSPDFQEGTSGPKPTLTAAEIVNTWSEDDLATVFRKYGEDPQARKIARALVSTRKHQKFTSTLQLADVIAAVSPRRGRLHPATKVFQALRLVVNDELGELEKGLQAATESLRSGGRLAIITFHSLEDRLVKHWIQKSPDLEAVSKKPITASQTEVKSNPRSRSAKLRLAERN